MHLIRRFVAVIIVLGVTVSFTLIMTAGNAFGLAQQQSSPLNAVGSGARAMGMGGAFIGVADDATAASWNPGGLIQLETPEMSAVYSYYSKTEDYTWNSASLGTLSSDLSVSNLNYASVAYPFRLLDRNIVVSVNYQHLYNFDSFIDQTTHDETFDFWGTGEWMFEDMAVSVDQTGGLYTISPAFAVQVTPQFSLGMTFNFWQNIGGRENGWDKQYNYEMVTTFDIYPTWIITDTVTTDHEYTFNGFNMHLGFLWDINEMFTVGGVYKTPFRADIGHKETDVFVSVDSLSGTTGPFINIVDETIKMDMPASYGLGLAVRFSDAFTMGLDVYHTKWEDLAMTFESGAQENPLTGTALSTSKASNTTQVRLGAEYLFIKENTVIPVRAGAFYDPEPMVDEPDSYYGFSLGSGFMWKSLVMDAAYQYRWGTDVKKDLAEPGSSGDVTQHTVLISAIYHF